MQYDSLVEDEEFLEEIGQKPFFDEDLDEDDETVDENENTHQGNGVSKQRSENSFDLNEDNNSEHSYELENNAANFLTKNVNENSLAKSTSIPSERLSLKSPTSKKRKKKKVTISSKENKSRDKLENESFLSRQEENKAREAYAQCLFNNDQTINFEQCSYALAILGQVLTETKLKELYAKAKSDSITLDQFLFLLNQLRKESGAVEKSKEIREAFDDLFSGTCHDEDKQKDEHGNKYLLVKDLRLVLTTYGDTLTDEEADELIRECHPIPNLLEDGTIDQNEGNKKIFFEQYRAMLLDAGV